ncbi:hypothetical protein [Burkholderia gladioli]|uniref:hypothetical protein n=1 Tax=Burkholderia gladioli TaxID=28095 RepID=UPI00163E5537|nr:hypothetical protein [Burkholderia gladioli]
MDATTQALIADLISHKIVDNWVFWFLFFMVSCLSALVASFLKAYGSRRGEQIATRRDFDDLKERLQATTRLTEEIKSEVGYIEWRMRETYTTRRAKLEEFVQQIGTVASTIDPWISKMLVGAEYIQLDSECLNRLEMFARLYFPALYRSTLEFTLSWRNIVQHGVAAAQALSRIDQRDLEARRQQMDENLRVYGPLYREAVARRATLEQTVVTEMEDVIRFPSEPRHDVQSDR